jgi:uncharacterized membrane protein HdeD (DUF308 family)
MAFPALSVFGNVLRVVGYVALLAGVLGTLAALTEKVSWTDGQSVFVGMVGIFVGVWSRPFGQNKYG